MKPLIVNLAGGPCTGKSTLAAKIFSELKSQNYEVEMASEYVKDLVFEESFKKIDNGILIFANQHHRIFRLENKTEIIITDSPLLNSAVYYRGSNPHFEDLIMWEYKNMNNLTFLLNRNFPYKEGGRMQTIEEAKKIDDDYRNLLVKWKVDFIELTAPYYIEEITKLIKNKL